jgi:hypothetical protein
LDKKQKQRNISDERNNELRSDEKRQKDLVNRKEERKRTV